MDKCRKKYLNTKLKISRDNFNKTKKIIKNWRIKNKQDVPWLKLTDTQNIYINI